MLNKSVNYGINRQLGGLLLLLKARELAHNLTGKSKELDFASPEFGGKRVNSHEIRQKILSISYAAWKKLGFSKGTLHYVKQNAKINKPFTLTAMYWRELKPGKT
jgi:CRISPR-associated protein Cas1